MDTKTVCQIDANGYFIGTAEAEESRKPGVYLIPCDCVDLPEPVVPPGQRAKLVAGAFVLEDIPPPPESVPEPPPVPPTVEQLHANIDGAAGSARARYITVAPGQEATYLLKEQQARAYAGIGYLLAEVANYPYVQAEAMAINGTTPTAAQYQAAANGIIAQADAWLVKGAQIERERIGGKRAVSVATTDAERQAAADAAITALTAC